MKPKTSQGVVSKCVPTHDGTWLVITRNKLSASSPVEVPEGRMITIRDGLVEVRRG